MVLSTNPKFLVTGGGGYIGFHIGMRLLQLGYEVVLFDLRHPSSDWDHNISVQRIHCDELEKELITCSAGKVLFIKGIPFVFLAVDNEHLLHYAW